MVPRNSTLVLYIQSSSGPGTQETNPDEKYINGTVFLLCLFPLPIVPWRKSAKGTGRLPCKKKTFRTTVPFWGQLTYDLTGLSPKTGLRSLKGIIIIPLGLRDSNRSNG